MHKFVLAAGLSALLLVGCNSNTADQNNDTPADDVNRGVNDTMNDTRDAIDDTIDTVDPNQGNGNGTGNNGNGNGTGNGNGGVNESTIDNNGAYPNGSSNPNGENGATAPGAPSVNQEDIIEDDRDRKDQDKVDNH